MAKRLIELTEQNCDVLLKKEIYVYPYAPRYLFDLKFRLPIIFSSITSVIEPNKRYRREDNNISIISFEEFQRINSQNVALIIMDDYYQEMYDRIEGTIDSTIECYFFLDNQTANELVWRNRISDKPLEKKILFRSGPHASQYVRGTDFSDNALAVFEYMVKNGLDREYKLVWLVKNPGDYQEKYAESKNIEFISFDWYADSNLDLQEKYYYNLFTAKYVLFTDAYGFARNCREGQIRIQLWHGCGFKTRTNFVPCEKRYEYNIVVSELYKKIHAKIYGLRSGQVEITGYPKADWLFNPCSQTMLEKLGIKMASKYIFWLPTFRVAKPQLSELNEQKSDGEIGLPVISCVEDATRINDELLRYNTQLIIKLHPFQDSSAINLGKFSNIMILNNETLVENNIQINQLLGHADALISDYSSVAVEYLLLDRPMAFTIDDVVEYEKSRGFVFDNIREYLPGGEILEINDFFLFVHDICTGRDNFTEKRRSLLDKMHQYKDGESCKRFVDWMIQLK